MRALTWVSLELFQSYTRFFLYAVLNLEPSYCKIYFDLNTLICINDRFSGRFLVLHSNLLLDVVDVSF